MTRIRPWFLAAAATLGTVCQLRAQLRADTAVLCWGARPAPDCRVFLQTNAGVYPQIATQDGPGRALEDLGLMVNVTPHDAVGASYFVSADLDGVFTGGPALRYRRWTSPRASLDVAVGFRRPACRTERSAVFGVVKYSPVPWFGVALRPEIVRSCPAQNGYCDLTRTGTVSRFRLSAGIEFGGVWGLVVPMVGAAMGAVIFALNPPTGI